MIITQSSNGKTVTITGLTADYGTPSTIKISKGIGTTTYIPVTYVSGDTLILDSTLTELTSFFDSYGIWLDDIYVLQIEYVANTVNINFLTYYNATKKIFTIEGKIPYDVRLGYQFDKNIQYGSYTFLLYKSMLIAATLHLWERANYILTAINKLNDNYVYR